MTDAVQRGLSAINEFVPDFVADHAGRMEVFTYGPAGGEPTVESFDFGVHEIDGSDVAEWVTEGATIVISLKRRRRAEPALGDASIAACATDPLGATAQVTSQDVEPKPGTAEGVTAPSASYRSAHGVVPRMPRAAGIEE